MPKPFAVLLAAALACVAVPATASAATPVTTASVLTQSGLGSIEIGMTVATARQRTGQKIDFTSFERGDDRCAMGRLFPLGLGVTYLATDRRFAVINVAEPGIATRAGIEVGDSAADLRAAYGAKLRSQPSKYEPKARDYSVAFSNKRKLVFYANAKGKVTQMAGGRQPEIDYVEGCS